MTKHIKKEITTNLRGTTLPEVSLVIPVHNEQDNIVPLLDEIKSALDHKLVYEIVYVDDGSTDETSQILQKLCNTEHNLKFEANTTKLGQSTAIYLGVLSAKAPIIATLDGDGQNDPADITTLLKAFYELSGNKTHILINGWRKNRNDIWAKRISSLVANLIRSKVLSDNTPDTGCGLKIFRKEDFLSLPSFNHMHRFLPALMLRSGGQVESILVNHRPRSSGSSKYGTIDRLWVGLIDLFGVTWLNRRKISINKNNISKFSTNPDDFKK